MTDIIAQKTRAGGAVVQPGDTAKSLLAGRVPYLQSDDGVRGRIEDALCDERRADGRGGCGVEGVAEKALYKRSLAHPYDIASVGDSL